MSKTMCPGQDTAFWRPGDIFDINCGHCGQPVEFFKDDASRRCRACGQKVLNPKLNMGCAQWCEHARDCLGFDPKANLDVALDSSQDLLERLIAEIRDAYKGRQTRFSQSIALLESVQRQLPGSRANPRLALAGALLYYPAQDLPDFIAETRLRSWGLDGETAQAVLELASGHSPYAVEAKLLSRALRETDSKALSLP